MNQWHCASTVGWPGVYLFVCNDHNDHLHYSNCLVPLERKGAQEQGGGLEKKLVCSDSWEMTGLGYSFQTVIAFIIYCFGFSSLRVQYQPYPGSFCTFYCWANMCGFSFWSCLQSQSVLGLGNSWPRQHLGLGAMAFLPGGLWQGDYFGVAGFHQVAFIEWGDTELVFFGFTLTYLLSILKQLLLEGLCSFLFPNYQTALCLCRCPCLSVPQYQQNKCDAASFWLQRPCSWVICFSWKIR